MEPFPPPTPLFRASARIFFYGGILGRNLTGTGCGKRALLEQKNVGLGRCRIFLHTLILMLTLNIWVLAASNAKAAHGSGRTWSCLAC
jgi:hypothetical protein